MLFQGTTTTNNDTLRIKNMSNDSLSSAAVEAIGHELLNTEQQSVEVVCTVSSDDNEFDVYASDTYAHEGAYLFSITNSGVTYKK